MTFEWSLYTKPFKTNAADYVQYRYVRLDIKSDSEIQLGELELMSTGMPALNADALDGMIAEAIKAKEALSNGGYAPLVTLMSAAIGEAQRVADKENKTDAEIEEACRKLINATSEIEGMKDLWTKLDAIKNVDTSNMPSAVQNSVRSAISNAENVTTNDSSSRHPMIFSPTRIWWLKSKKHSRFMKDWQMTLHIRTISIRRSRMRRRL